jgi:hypothetical protein
VYKFISLLFFIFFSLSFYGVSFAQILNDAPDPIEAPRSNYVDLSDEELIIEEGFTKEDEEFLQVLQNDDSLRASETTVSCFDNYNFGSVQADLKTNVTGTVPSVAVPFFGEIKNNNAYPIVNGTLYVKIFKVNSDSGKNYNGPDVVDQFIVAKNLNLNANESKPVEFSWQVPLYARGGKYQLVTFFVANHKYNLLGLSFTDDVVGNMVEFNVVDDRNTGVYFDKNTVTINDAPYFFAAFPPRLDPKKPVVIKATVVNTTNEAVNLPVSFKTFYWDAMHQANSLDEKEQWVSVPAKGTAEVSFSVLDNKYPVYLSEIVLKYKDTKSILNPRFVIEGINRLRINFPAVKQYPLIKGEEVELFACFHNTTDSAVPGRLLIQVLDQNHNLIHEHEFSGNVSGDMMATLDKFVPKKSYESFTIKAFLYQGDELVDEDTVYYKCEEFNVCGTVEEKNLFWMNLWNNKIAMGIILFVLIIASIFFRFLVKSKSKVQKIMILLLVSSTAFLLNTDKVEAESVMWTLPRPVFLFTNSVAYMASNALPNYTGGNMSAYLQNVTATVRYNTRVLNWATGEVVPCGSSVPIGTRLKFEFIPHQPEDVTWFGTGSSYDSPYGSWKNGGGAPAEICTNKNFLKEESTVFAGLWTTYTDLSVHPPNKAIGGLPATCTNVGSNKDCVMNVLGTYNALFQFSNTYGLFHWAYSNSGGSTWYNYPGLGANSCRRNRDSLLVTNSTNTNLITSWATINHMAFAGGLPLGITIRASTMSVYYYLIRNAYDLLVSEWSKVDSHIPISPQQISCPITVTPLDAIPVVPGALQTPTVTRNVCVSNPFGNAIPYTFRSVNTGKNVRFLIDWNNDNLVDQILPPTGFTTYPSLSTTRVWEDSSRKTFNVTIEEEGGGYSRKVFLTSETDCESTLNFETELITEDAYVRPLDLFEGGVRQVVTNRECSLDLGTTNASTCTLTKTGEEPITVRTSDTLKLAPGRYYISCTQWNGQVFASDLVCLLSPNIREI